MKISGYSHKFRIECLLSAKNAFKVLTERQISDGSPMYRTRDEMVEAKLKKNRSSSDWWKAPDTISKQFTSVLFVPPTPGGELAKRLKKRETELNFGNKMNIKIIEKGGIKIKNILVKKDPFPALKCNEKNCPFCNESPQIETLEKQKCSAHNVGYRFQCQDCQFTYEGETFRRIAVRAGEHVVKLKNESNQSPLWKHILEHHPQKGHEVKFTLIVTGSFFDSLTRQADEGLRIQERKGKLMNSKSEFNAPKLQRIGVKDVNLD